MAILHRIFFKLPGKGYGGLLRLQKEQFVEALALILTQGSRQEVFSYST